MASLKPTKQEADEIIKARKIVSASAAWKSFLGTWRLEVAALEPKSDTILRLIGYIGRHNYSFSILHRNYPIRKFTKHDKHKFKGETIREPHKHKWDEVTLDAEVYIPKDIDPTANINDQFLAFCRECNIELKGGYQPLVYELGR